MGSGSLRCFLNSRGVFVISEGLFNCRDDIAPKAFGLGPAVVCGFFPPHPLIHTRTANVSPRQRTRQLAEVSTNKIPMQRLTKNRTGGPHDLKFGPILSDPDVTTDHFPFPEKEVRHFDSHRMLRPQSPQIIDFLINCQFHGASLLLKLVLRSALII